jgi:cytochrome c peroxidase
MKFSFSLVMFFSLLFVSLSSCKKEDDNKDIVFEVPANFPSPTYNFSNNPVTKAGFELGRKLFYDPMLSRDNTISCGSCHIQTAAFTHHGHGLSHGIDDLLGKRNSPPVMNMAWSETFFWDGGVHNLDLVTPNPIENPVEMDLKFSVALDKVRNNSDYKKMFKAAFGSEEVTSAKFLQAMSQFMNMLVSANSRYDKYVRGEGETLSSDELEGLNLFKQKCSSCHSTDLFTDNGFHNNGLSSTFPDSGRYNITLSANDLGKFKTPSLRNIEKTKPYMHNGSIGSLESVLNHYASGVKQSATLDPLLQQNGQLGIPMTEDEKAKIILFLKTLTDTEFLKDRRFSEF